MGGRGSSSGIPARRNVINISDMPKLTGSEKQIKWAEQIRDDAIGTVNGNIRTYEERIRKYPESKTIFESRIKAYEEVGRQLNEVLQKITSASQIIDKREYLSGSYINQAADKIEEMQKKKREKK